MDLIDAGDLAVELMAEHGLIEDGWGFGFDCARRRAGACHYRAKRITISKLLAATQADDFVWETLLHEIAHALAGAEAGHGATWRRIAQRIGSTGQRCYAEVDLQAHPALVRRWQTTCVHCGHTLYRDRRPRNSACRTCCNTFGGGVYDERFRLQWLPTLAGAGSVGR